MADESRGFDHLYVHDYVKSVGFDRRPGGRKKEPRNVDRFVHGHRLKQSVEAAFKTVEVQRSAVALNNPELGATGTVIVLEGEDADYPLKIDSLSSRTGGRNSKPKWLLLSVREAAGKNPERATVWVADEHRQSFLKLFEDYLSDEHNSKKGNPKNQDLIANISRIREAVLADLWTSDSIPPQIGLRWWELWLDASSPHVEDWQHFAASNNLKVLHRELRLGVRLIVWVEATWAQLQTLPFTSIPITEIRRPGFIDTVEDLSIEEQNEYVEDLAERISPAAEDSPAVCHLDTGVFRTHILLEKSLAAEDVHSIFGGSGTDVNKHGHGTAMAGLSLYGDLDSLLSGTQRLSLRHRLESVRMEPTPGETSRGPLDWGTATADAVTHPEAVQVDRPRVFCLTLSNPDPDKPGEPTLWSATVDALAVGTDVVRSGEELQLLSTHQPNSTRLIVAAAGNVGHYEDDYQTNCVNSPIHDPAQAWNALTVGAYTDIVRSPTDPQYSGWKTVAVAGDISPHTSTSLYFDMGRWPIKPDICMEGGNVLSDGAGLIEDRLPSLSLRSTGHKNNASLTSANATSAATAQASRLAALAMNRYPTYWPETIRGLLPHSAEWTDTMAQRLGGHHSKRDRQRLLREFGWGVPSEDAVLNSRLGAVTLVTQDSFVPFTGSNYSMRHFRLHSLPWPTDVLESLGETPVRLRVTLSYFIEPSASRRGWRNKYSYASHGLRFDLQGRLENPDEFINRVNREAQKEEGGSRVSESDRWFLGERGRHLGSLHQDEWNGTGAELANCNNVAVYPVGGWWKNNRKKDRRDLSIRYSLILSLQTDKQGVDLYTPIATQLQIPVTTQIPIAAHPSIPN